MRHLKQVGINFGCNTQINRLSAPEFPQIYERLRDAGIQWSENWQQDEESLLSLVGASS